MMFLNSRVFVLFFVMLWRCSENGRPLKGDIFAAFSQLEQLAFMERNLVKDLEQFVTQEEIRLGMLKRFTLDVKEASEDDKLLSPVSSYHVIKRFIFGWNNLESFLNQARAKEMEQRVRQSMLVLPTSAEDLTGAVTALLRLQVTYNLTARAVVQGDFPGCLAAPAAMSARDCYEIGVQAYSTGHYAQSRDWLNEALRLLGGDHHDDAEITREVFELLAEAEYIKGDIEQAIHLTKRLTILEPTLHRAKEALRFYQKVTEKDLENSEPHAIAREEEIVTADFTRGAYASLCRGEQLENQSASDEPMTCWYHHLNLPRLLLKPIKAEMLLRSPDVLLFHNVVSDTEADVLRNLARPMLSRAKVIDTNGELEDADYRISKNAWLSDDHEVVTRVNRRFELVTGLDDSTAEALQVANYGIGGQYEPHHDFGLPGSPIDTSMYGNRIATLLVYLNDVESGGFTVFVQKGLHIKPRKGDAVFWYNLKRSGAGDYDTLHAGCPVLCGSKWVANKWYHERGQEFRRQCALDPDL